MRHDRFHTTIPAITLALALLLAGCTGLQGSGGSFPVPQANPTDTPIVVVGGTAEPDSGQTPATSHGGPVKDYVSLVDNLRAQGATVEPAGEISQPFFSVQGYAIKVNGADVQAFEYADAASAEADAAKVSSDGSTIGTSMVDWVGPPHFYKVGRVIVLYVGDDQGVIDILQKVLGAQFAGR